MADNGSHEALLQRARRAERETARLKETEEKIKESEENFRALYEEAKRAEQLYLSLLNSSADAIAVFDLEGRVQFLSPSFTRVFGWTLEESRGKRIAFLHVSETNKTMSFFKELLSTGKPVHGFETKRLTKQGRLLDVSISASRFHDHRGQPAGVLMVLRDITETRKLRAQFQQAHKLEAIGTLAGGIAHDFNNLLMGIQANVSLLNEMLKSQSAKLKNIDDYIQSGRDLTKQLLDFSRGEKCEVRPTDLNEVVKRQNRMFGRTQKNITLRGKYEEAIWPVEVDVGQLEQVLLNLYVNSAQAMEGGGNLFIETANVVLDPNFCQQVPYPIAPGRYVKIAIADTGVGMDPETQQRIFDPFFTTKEGDAASGTGLGLASAYGIIKNHGGLINVFSKKGEGTTFNIYLPCSDRKPPPAPEEDETVWEGTETLLLVDDEDLIVDVQEVLRTLGYEVLLARGGREAIEMYQARRDHIALVILDMVMPDMGGGEVFDRLRAINPEIRVLLSSGYGPDGAAAHILGRGCNGFLQKPFNVNQLSRKIRSILDAAAS